MGFKGKRAIGKMGDGRRKLKLAWSRSENKRAEVTIRKTKDMITEMKNSFESGETEADK